MAKRSSYDGRSHTDKTTFKFGFERPIGETIIKMVSIVLNGENKQIEGEVTLDQLLDLFSLPKQRVAVELNKSVVRKHDWEKTSVNDADVVEVIHFVGGG